MALILIAAESLVGACGRAPVPGEDPDEDTSDAGAPPTKSGPLTAFTDETSFPLPAACFGVLLDLGASDIRSSNTPVTHRLHLMFARSETSVQKMLTYPVPSFPAGIYVYAQVASAAQQRVEGYANGMVGLQNFVGGSMTLTQAALAGLPGRTQPLPPFSSTTGTISGVADLTLHPPIWGETKTEVVGRVKGSFVARRCQALDATLMK